MLGSKGIPPEDSYLVKTIHLTVRCKGQFPDVITKHWTFKTTCMILRSPQFFLLLVLENDWLYCLEDDPSIRWLLTMTGSGFKALKQLMSDGPLVASSALP